MTAQDYTSQHNDANTELAELERSMNLRELRYLVARMNTDTDQEAAKNIGLSSNDVRNMRRNGRGEVLDRALLLMAQDGVITAREIQRKSVAEAMAVMHELTQSDDQRVRFQASKTLVEWELGQARQQIDQRNTGSVTLVVQYDQGKHE